jgi:hypothetical protein
MIQRCTKFSGFDDKFIKMFWTVCVSFVVVHVITQTVSKMTQPQLQLLLRFATGSDRIPITGFALDVTLVKGSNRYV